MKNNGSDILFMVGWYYASIESKIKNPKITTHTQPIYRKLCIHVVEVTQETKAGACILHEVVKITFDPEFSATISVDTVSYFIKKT